MSTASRLISGSAASWVRIGVNVVSQVILVPLYLTHWSIETYGLWIAIQALVGILFTLDTGHQEFLGYEFMRIGREDRSKLSKYLWSGISIGMGISLLQIALIIVFILTNVVPLVLGKADSLDSKSIHDVSIVLLLQGVGWLICTSITGLLFRALAPFGYYPRMAWWNCGYAFTNALIPAVLVVFGTDLLMTGIISNIISIVLYIPLYIDLFRLLRREEIEFSTPSWQIGIKNFGRSLAVFGKIILESLRQQGVRLVLAPLTGVVGLVAFTTMRTGANVALQGLNSITNPLMPDLMRFLHQRDQARSESAFGTVWIIIVAIMAPAVVVLQAFVEPFYIAWTRGKVPFDPWLFATLSLSVLVYAVVQPATTVVIGNNLLKPQLFISLVGATTVVVCIYILVPHIGILGGGVSLLTAEIFTTVGYVIVAKRWLQQNGLVWPMRSFLIVVTSVIVSGAIMAVMILLPNLRWIVLAVSMLLFIWNAWHYWKLLPLLATQQARKVLSHLPGVNKLFPA
ncbi:lipopolysaccharide biosynthesis protein [Spirosoma utsteinense]|uniref:O-antigen/teichoic acid export membrane protein n=1 Tax=Spirosoma utsteinense TaxID=2585773 RepID=A0ABR6WDC5_9BACT|nr:polysaccharide biosynthesis C-terminal domain-containing protein [Spirosoma utsteinense]MBC3788545.1 O-antigen/teichoic acid export membrane protein [Spirosoma utsteinense]MBC3794564.1 O-antigen/teichoic acid export membrane protein [Spirosoma utsteinense]